MTPAPGPPLRGVNLGNWLLLEKWMAPRLFDGTAAGDEYSLSAALGPGAEHHILHHRDTYITQADFAWLKRCGLNAVRIPFGYWLFDPDPPYVASPRHLDMALAWAQKYHLQVLLDLHGLPGAQGPEHHTGRAGHFQWHRDPRHLNRSLDLIEHLAQRYAGCPALRAFSVVNEPEPTVGRDFLVRFYEQAYDRVRQHLPADRVAFVLAAYPEGEMPKYHGCLPGRQQVWTDVHLYQSFGDWSRWTLLDYLAYPLGRQSRLRVFLDQGPAIVGEWSLALAAPLEQQIQALPALRQELLRVMHGRMLLALFEEFQGWFFWSYRVEGRPQWSFRDAVARGWLPQHYADPAPAAPPALASIPV